jgi:hypothetical protein
LNADQLISFSSKTDDNGTPHQVSISTSPKGILLRADGKALNAPTGTLPTSFWSTRFLKAKALINNDNGSVTKVISRNMGSEHITLDNRVHRAQHYKITGENDFERDLWFEGEQLLRVQLKGSDGSLITSDLQQ